ncbi:MAG: hypothetical protein V3U96_09720 [Paracoccaceae bacterium]
MQTCDPKTVKKRRVFYIPGYDPHPPRRYRELYRKQGAKQAGISGYQIAVEQRIDAPGYGWQVQGVFDGHCVASEIDVLVWSDLVQKSMGGSIASSYVQLVRTAWIYISTGALRRLMWLGKGPMLAAFYPVGMLLAQAMVAIGLGLIIGGALSSLTVAGAGWIVGLPVFVLVLRWFKDNDGRFYAHYLMRDYAFTAKNRGRNPAELEARLDRFRHQIELALASDVDEVLVVGHSSGVHLAVNIIAQILRNEPAGQARPELALLSLGQVVPMVSFLPAAGQLRADLVTLSLSDVLTWVDVSAPGDGCCFALCDPVAVSGVAQPHKRWPLVFSAAFSKSLSPELWARLRRRYFRLHFQYLCAFDRPRDYDYFQITAGPVTLAARYKDRPASKSRIDVAASPYTSLAP